MHDTAKRIDHNFSDVLPQPEAVLMAHGPGSPSDSTPVTLGLKQHQDLVHSTGNWIDTDTMRQIGKGKNYDQYNTTVQKMNELKSSLDNHNYQPDILKSNDMTS